MKYLIIQPDIAVSIPFFDREGNKQTNEKIMSHHDWLMALVDDQQLCETPKDIRLSIKLAKMFVKKNCTPGATIALEDADRDRLQKIYDKPSTRYNPHVARACEPFMDAWDNISDSRPAIEAPILPQLPPAPPSNGTTSEAPVAIA